MDLLTKIVREKRRVAGISETDAIDALGTEISALLDYARRVSAD
jgi:hypothetical protein